MSSPLPADCSRSSLFEIWTVWSEIVKDIIEKFNSYFTQNCIVFSLQKYVNIHSTFLPNTHTHTHIL